MNAPTEINWRTPPRDLHGRDPVDDEQARYMAQVCLDLHDALGVAWGGDPYAEIRRLRALEAELAERKRPVACGVCLGRPLASGKQCVCGDVGTEQAEMHGLRVALFDAEAERDAAHAEVEAQRSHAVDLICESAALRTERAALTARVGELERHLHDAGVENTAQSLMIARLAREKDDLAARVGDANNLLDMAWGVIANAGAGNWTRESLEWQEAAARWRDRWHAQLDATATPTPDADTHGRSEAESAKEGNYVGARERHNEAFLRYALRFLPASESDPTLDEKSS